VPQSLTKCGRSSAWQAIRVFADQANLF
jgi:hypothetical protein